MADGLKQCYNKGCGQKYKEEENNESVCTYHPGNPVFHDAMKGWSCCKKRSTDFTDFLNIPGCTTGCHNPVKPPEPDKPVITPLKEGEEIIVKGPPLPKPMKDMPRPSDDLPFIRLSAKVSTSLKSLLARLQKQEQEMQDAIAKEGDNVEGSEEEVEVKIGTNCKNNSCSMIYVGPETNLTQCQHHPGVAIFHDGYKFWSCCQRRTSDFNEFQRQEGCTTGDHVWVKVVQKTQSCRYDWHQTGTQVVMTVYAKACIPEKCSIEVNPTIVRVNLSFENGKSEFSKDIKLHGVIDPAKSTVELLGAKVDIKMKKADPISWAQLEIRTAEPKPNSEDNE